MSCEPPPLLTTNMSGEVTKSPQMKFLMMGYGGLGRIIATPYLHKIDSHGVIWEAHGYPSKKHRKSPHQSSDFVREDSWIWVNIPTIGSHWLPPPQRGWGKPHGIATCDVFHRLKFPAASLEGCILGATFVHDIWCVYIYICISILAYILSACSNSPTMKLGILPFTNCKLTAVGDYIPVYILPFRDVPSTDVNWESLQTCNSTHSNGSASMYFKSTSIKDKAINGSAFSHQISHELKSPESWRDCHDNS